VPYINQAYRINDTRLLVGESFGGLFAAYVLMFKPSLFTDYLITDATYVWDNNYLNRQATKRYKSKDAIKANVYLSLANNEHLGDIGKSNFQLD